MTEFTQQEAGLLKEIIGQIQLKPSEPNAVEVCRRIQSILAKIDALTEKEPLASAVPDILFGNAGQP